MLIGDVQRQAPKLQVSPILPAPQKAPTKKKIDERVCCWPINCMVNVLLIFFMVFTIYCISLSFRLFIALRT